MNRRTFTQSLFASALLGGIGKSALAEETTAMSTPSPFTIAISDAQLADLKDRLERTRWPDEPADAGWALGTNLDYMRSLTRYWIDEYDWRQAEQRLNALGNFKVELDGVELHFVHRRSTNPDAVPLLLLHGWPDSFFRYHRVIDELSRDFHVVVPSIPGTGFSGRTALPMDQVADLFARLMSETLGYGRFIAAGGDGGSIISMSLAQRHPDRLLGYHVTDVGYPDQNTDFAALTPPEQAYAGAIQQWFFAHGAFNLIHATKPQSLAFAMHDSPVGLAAWIMSFMAGMGLGQDADLRFGRDELITNIMIYWLTETAASSFRIYSQNMMQPPTITGINSAVPVAVATEVPIPGGVRLPREWAERQTGGNVVQFTDMEKAGHFAAWEDPDVFIGDIRAFAARLR
ncbi:Pimeloyl-ACP methyl ester carboxylesterase [Devosia lucknowensis]|uniref:Pimeloyl-ACP methyl ester carboxylesterase n=1 Tax=Devosia lucknowensis TaxID=1096929 RepID=A0A1Y6F6G0_9HYPH|nr:epoxide hydrolase family protein [Devosia lucknowensis]SMQ70159.1 Pimeloyl-ACP methyl ester carboxylesterase [Devosia lucknowensis]